MNLRSNRFLTLSLFGLTAGLGTSALQGCDDEGPLGNLAEQCGLVCNSEAFVEGQANVSGVASIDAFFGAAINLNATMTGVSGELRAELDAIGASVGLEPGATGAELSAAIQGHLDGYIEGGLTIDYQPPECRANVDVSIAAAAECDVEADPGSLTVSCEGSCQAEAGVAVDCGAEATLMCEGTAPNLQCDGTCSGSCSVEAMAMVGCSGTCRGSCTANGSTMDGFDGRCDGECTGECVTDLSAGGSCSGTCEGSCRYTAPEAGCDASAQASCEAQAGASIECDAGCEGSAEPPQVSAECEASVDAQASASLECFPPTLSFGYQFAAGLDGNLTAQAEFRAWLETFRGHFSAILALRARGEVIGDAAANLVASASGALQIAVEDIEASGDFSAGFGAACALGQLPVVATTIGDSAASLGANVSASAEVVGAFGG